MKKIPNTFSFLLFIVGAALGFALALLATWADFEANFYGFSRQTSNPFQGLTCPMMMTRNETREISVRVKNTASKPISPNVRIEISSPLTPVKSLDFVDIDPGESVTLTKTIGRDNIDLERFIFVKALVYAAYPMSDAEGTCGVFILPVNGSSTVIIILWMLFSLLLTGGGLYLLRVNGLESRKLAPLIFIGFLVLPALAFSFLGWWVPTAFVMVVTALAFVVSLGGLVTA